MYHLPGRLTPLDPQGGGSKLVLTGIDIYLNMHLLSLPNLLLPGTSLRGGMNG